MISCAIASFWKAFNLLMSDLVVFIHLSSANYLNNMVVVFMVQIYGF